MWKGKDKERKEDLEILESPLAERARGKGENKKERMVEGRADDYRIVWITRAVGEQRMSKRLVEMQHEEEKDVGLEEIRYTQIEGIERGKR